MHPPIQELHINGDTRTHSHKPGAIAPAWGNATEAEPASVCSSYSPEYASAPRVGISQLESWSELNWREDTPHRELPEPETRLAELAPLVAVVIVFLALSLTAGVVFDTYTSRSSPDATSTAASSLSPAGMSDITRQLSGEDSMSAPTSAEFIYLIGGLSP